MNNLHEITQRTKDILLKLNDRGVLIGIATGRTTSSLIKYLNDLQLVQEKTPIVSFNGACGHAYNNALNTLTLLSNSPVSESSVRLLISLAEQMNLVMQYYNANTGDVYAVPLNDSHKDLLKRYAILTGREQVFLKSYEDAIAMTSSAKIMIMTEDPDELIAKANAIFPSDLFYIIKGSPDPFFVEFLSPGINKGSCLKKVFGHFDIKSESISFISFEFKSLDLVIVVEDVVAFGDGDNDADMLKQVGMGIAVKNAKSLAKESAKIVLEYSNDDDGVARQLEYMLEKNMFM